MSQTTSTPSTGGPSPTGGPDALDRFFSWLRGLGIRRDSQDKWAAGVAAGVARRLGIDPVLVRVAFFVLALFGGFGVTAYLVGWALLPNDRDEILAERAIRHGEGWPIVLLVVTALSLFGGGTWGHDGGPGWWGLGWVVPVGIIGWIIYRTTHHLPILPRSTGGTGGPVATPPPPSPYAGQFATEPGTSTYAAPSGTTYTAPAGTSYAAPPVARAPRPVRPPRPPKPRRLRPGSAITLLTLGLGVAAYGIGVLVDGPTGFPGSAHLLGSILALAVVAVAVITLGLAGRKAGFLGFVVTILAIGTAISTVSPSPASGGMGDRSWAPTAAATDTSYELGIGSATLDLSGLPTTTTTPTQIDVSVGLGDLTIQLPQGMDAKVVTDMGAGEVLVDGTKTHSTHPGRNAPAHTYTWTTPSGGATDVIVDVHLGAGSVHIDQGQ